MAKEGNSTREDFGIAEVKRAIPERYVLTLLGFFGFFCVYSLRVNLNVALVAMVREPLLQDIPRAEDTKVACLELVKFPLNDTSSERWSPPSTQGEFDWDSNMQGLVLGSFYYGYVITQIPGGVMAERFGGKWLFGVGILMTSIISVLMPVVARWNVWALVAARAIQGLFEGVTCPAMHCLIGKWLPKQERSLLSTIIYNGYGVGTVVTLAVAGILCDTDFLGGWPSVFYASGAFGCLWFVFWMAFVHDSPDSHPRISTEELLHIRLGQDKMQSKASPVPWKKILTSVPVLALTVTHFGQNWGFYTLLTYMPTYLANVLHFNMEENGTLSALPNLVEVFIAVLAGIMADKLVARRKLHITTIRKIMNSIAFFVPALCLLPIGFVGCQPVLIVILLTLAVSINGFIYSGFNVVHVDMSPEFAGTLMGITNCIANIPGFLAPSFVGWMIQDGNTLENWRTVFLTSSGIFVVSGIVFNIFCTSELQPWGSNSKTSKETSQSSDFTPMTTTTTKHQNSNS